MPPPITTYSLNFGFKRQIFRHAHTNQRQLDFSSITLLSRKELLPYFEKIEKFNEVLFRIKDVGRLIQESNRQLVHIYLNK